MSTIPELDATHIAAACALLSAAAKAGVYKLGRYADVVFAYNECRRIAEASREEGFKIEDVPVSSLVAITKLLEFAANSNGFAIADFQAVLAIISIFVTSVNRGGVEEAKE